MSQAPAARESGSIRDRIQSLAADFTKADQRIARTILSDYPMAGLQTLVDLGRDTQSSPATVLRFIGKLGFSGYPEFQKVLRDELQSTLDSPLSRYKSGEALGDSGEPLAQYAGYATTLIEETASMVPPSEFSAVVTLLSDVKRPVFVTGGRYSRGLAQLFCYGLSAVRGRVTPVEDDNRALVEVLADIGKRDIVVVFDFRRYQLNIRRFAEEAAAAGAQVMLFTDRWRSPCARFADHVLALPVASPSVFDSGLSALLCLEAIVARLAEILDETGEARIARIEALYGRVAGGPPVGDD